MPEQDTNAPEGNALPETLSQDQDLATFKTVEDLVAGYKAEKTKASTIGSIETISPELRADPNISKYKSLEELAKGHLETVKLVGRKGVIVPNEKDSPEMHEAYRKALGVPSKPEEYKFTSIDNLHPEIKMTPEASGGFAQLAHKFNLTQSQADGLLGWYMTEASNGLLKRDEASTLARKDAETKLRSEWGDNFNNNIALANRVVNKFGGKDALEAFGELGNKPGVLKFLAGLGKKMSEDSISRGESSDLTLTTDSAKKKIESMNRTIQGMKGDEPDYQKLIKERTELYNIAYPEGGES